MAGITDNGFQKREFNELKETMFSVARSIFGDEIDLRKENFIAQFCSVMAKLEAERWDVLEDIYNNTSVANATGISLDYLVAFQGIRRKQATRASGLVTFSGDDNTVINSGFIVKTEDGKEYRTTESKTITSGSVDINCECLIAGSIGNTSSSTITEIEEPLNGLDSITNNSEFDNGVNRESDESLRLRYLQSLAKGGGSTSNAIRAAILSIENVRDALVFENETDTVKNGIDPHNFVPYVLGGVSEDIQNEIFSVKSLGIKCQGTDEKTFTTDSGSSVTIGIERPTEIDTWYNVDVTPGDEYPIDGDTQVKDLVLEYVSSLGIGKNVIIFSLLNYIANNVNGLLNLSIETSEDGINYSQADITIEKDISTSIEKAVTDVNKVVIV
ncbi:MAG: baseplate J/gp47 family protein [Clostridiales bacterium]|nr:baseplate J/gp47 family protein [Clostridiales bacterium]